MTSTAGPAYRCSACARTFGHYMSSCACGAWNTITIAPPGSGGGSPRVVATPPIKLAGTPNAARPLLSAFPAALPHSSAIAPVASPTRERSIPVALTDIDVHQTPKISTSIRSLDVVLGGEENPGAEPASIILLTADPGAGKSTIAAQLAAGMGASLLVLYASGEETPGQVARRAQRIDACRDYVRFVQENDVDVILQHVDELGVRILIVDSMQTVTKVGLVAGADNTIRICIKQIMDHCKRAGVLVLIIGHVTKDGTAAGPQTLAHMVDATIHISLNEEFPEIRTVHAVGKNRFGPGAGGPSGMFRMTSTGLVDLNADEKDEIERRIAEQGGDSGDGGEGEEDRYEPIARELARRYVEIGGVVDADLRDRASGLDLF